MNNAFIRTTPPEVNKPLRRINNFLLVVLVAINLYVIAVPFVPQFLFRVEQSKGKRQTLEQSLQTPKSAAASTPPSSPNPQASPASQPNHVVIPAMLLDQAIVEGANASRALNKGVWRWPGGSTPDKGSNTVLVGHRFTYKQPKGVFYFLDKLNRGDTVGIVWDGKTYVYRVSNIQTVPPVQTSILDPTEDATLTMYTCTPLWLPKNRLVITAKLESIQGVAQ